MSAGRDADTYKQVASCGVKGAGYLALHTLLMTDLSLTARLPRGPPVNSGAQMSVRRRIPADRPKTQSAVRVVV